MRVHRSHIVNIERVVGYKRSGDNEMVELDAARIVCGAGQPEPDRLAKSQVAALTGDDPEAGLRRRHHFAAR